MNQVIAKLIICCVNCKMAGYNKLLFTLNEPARKLKFSSWFIQGKQKVLEHYHTYIIMFKDGYTIIIYRGATLFYGLPTLLAKY